MAFVGLVIPLVWPLFALMIMAIGQLIQRSGILGLFCLVQGNVYCYRLGCIIFWFPWFVLLKQGGSAVVAGKEVFGALNIFYAELQNNLPISPSATAFSCHKGKMPTFIFGLPAAALAMYHTAAPANRHKIKGLLLSGVVAAAITGIYRTNWIFILILLVHYYWLFHVIMTGLGFMVMALLGVVIGNTDGGLLDFVIFWLVTKELSTKWWWVLIVGAIWFVVYYFVFKTVIVTFDFKNTWTRQGLRVRLNIPIKKFNI